MDGRARPRTTFNRAALDDLITDRPQTRNIYRREVPLALTLVVLDILHRVAADLFSVLDVEYAGKGHGTSPRFARRPLKIITPYLYHIIIIHRPTYHRGLAGADVHYAELFNADAMATQAVAWKANNSTTATKIQPIGLQLGLYMESR